MTLLRCNFEEIWILWENFSMGIFGIKLGKLWKFNIWRAGFLL